MFEQFITWEMMGDFIQFVAIVFMVVAFSKEWKLVKRIPTQLYSSLIAFVGILLVQIHNGTYEHWDIVLYTLSAISISFFNGAIADRTSKK
jgi:hypothetical protein